MTFQQWQQLMPAEAARRVHTEIHAQLSPAQQRAAIAVLLPERELAARLEAATRLADPLRGVPYFAKDLFDVAGWPTYAGSTFLPEARPAPAGDSALIQALQRASAVLAGKSQLHEFAYGITGENAHYGDCEHPDHPGRTTGGSSSGSAALVAAGIVPLALGTDTGGSVRLPAAFCGLHGFRLTPGDPFIRDAVALAPSLDTAGWFTRTASDLRTVTAVLAGSLRATRTPQGCYLQFGGLDPDVADGCRLAAHQLGAGTPADTVAALHHGFAAAVEIYNTIVAREAWEVHRPWAERFHERYSAPVWQRLNRAATLTPAQHAAADAGREAIRALWAGYFAQYDFLALPAAPCPALTKPECTLENRNRILALTAPASLGGLPVLTIPIPLPSGLTAGLQVVVREPQSPVVDWALRQFE